MFNPHGTYRIEHLRNGIVIDDFPVPNGITNLAKNEIMDVYFDHATQRSSSWYSSLINNAGYTGIASGDTIASHAGWTEFTGYADASAGTTNRIPWGQGASSGQSKTNASAMIFNFNTTGVVGGIFMTDLQAKSNSSSGGMLWSTALFNAVIAVQSGDQLRVTYTLAC